MALTMQTEITEERRMCIRTKLPVNHCKTFLRLRELRHFLRVQDRWDVEKAVEECLLTEGDRRWMKQEEFSLRNLMEGMYCEADRPGILALFAPWNEKVGWEFFKIIR